MVVITGVSTAIAEPGGADPTLRLTGKGLRYKDRATKLALCAAGDALDHAGLRRSAALTVPSESVGVVVSSNFGNVDTICDSVDVIAARTYLGTSPMLLPTTASNVIASWVAILFRLRGANLTLCNGPTSGLDAVHWARLLIAAGRVERVLVIGVEPANAPVRHLTGAGPLFDGAAALVVEAEQAARTRGARPLAEVGPFARRATHQAAVAKVRLWDSRPIGVNYLPEGAPATPTGIDLTAELGRASGALGLLQCVAGVDWLGTTPTTSSLVLAGAGYGADAAAALLLGPVVDNSAVGQSG